MTNEQVAEDLIDVALSATLKISMPEKGWHGDQGGVTWRQIAPWQYDALKELIANALDADDALRSLVQQQADWIEKIVSVAEADIGGDWEVAVEIDREVIEAGYELLR